ncbi:MAG: class I SAM-dependent methyltransferase [Gammaproteobacteria bacterium]
MPVRDLAVAWQLAKGLPPGSSHAERLQRFYGPQARDYDAFRERLLRGRDTLVAHLPLAPGTHVIELGAGTGRNVAYYAERLAGLASVTLVDLCPALLDRARLRAVHWPQVSIIEADAAGYVPPTPVDCVYFSYALSMIPDWQAALANATRMLKPGGTLGVVDFYLADPAGCARARHPDWMHWLWPRWFARDGVRVAPDLLPAVCATTEACFVHEGLAGIPLLPGLRVPYFVYVGRAGR